MPTADLSVVIANRNHAHHLPRALDAVLSQSVRPREVIVLDDASTDDSIAVLEGYARQYPCLRLLRNDAHLGVTATYNRGFALATGEYILPGAADDYLLLGFIEKAMAQFACHPRAGVCVAHGSCTAGDDGHTGRRVWFTPSWVVETDGLPLHAQGGVLASPANPPVAPAQPSARSWRRHRPCRL